MSASDSSSGNTKKGSNEEKKEEVKSGENPKKPDTSSAKQKQTQSTQTSAAGEHKSSEAIQMIPFDEATWLSLAKHLQKEESESEYDSDKSDQSSVPSDCAQ